FTVVKENTYKDVQDIDYKDGYLWIVLHDSEERKNHIILAEIPTSYSEIENGKTYDIKKTISVDKNEAGRGDTLNELESIYVNGSYIYTWSNILPGWYETFCRYSRFPNAVTISSVTTKSKTSLEVKWNALSNADQYRIDRRADNSDDYVTVTTVDSSKTSYTDSGLTAGTKYYYRVYGVNSGGTSPRKNGVPGITRTTTPKVNSVTTISEASLKINWSGVTGAKKYIVCRRKDGSGEGWENYSRVAETSGTEYLDTGLEPNTKYYYGIVAVTETGVESGNPNENGNPGEENRGSGTTLGKYAIDLNRILDGEAHWELGECGTADIWINGKLVEDDKSDYWAEWPEGTRYEVKDIKTKDGYRYEGIQGGNLSGTVGKGNVDLRLIYLTIPVYEAMP
ncbi:MAG: fibronectin type III domain-containing protein, partial [Oscillospiraceae bacterium]|nr:fibronectin type III domain-containing protein [Oscillospiraceae bacterium]